MVVVGVVVGSSLVVGGGPPPQLSQYACKRPPRPFGSFRAFGHCWLSLLKHAPLLLGILQNPFLQMIFALSLTLDTELGQISDSTTWMIAL